MEQRASAAGDAVPCLAGMQPIARAPRLAGTRCGRTDVAGQVANRFCRVGSIFGSVNRNSNAPGFLECPWQVGQREQEGEKRGGLFRDIFTSGVAASGELYSVI